VALRCDVASEADVIRVVDAAFAPHGRLDVVVNNAGRMIFKPIEAHDEDDLLGVIRVDLFGAFWFIKQAFLRCKPGAAIVNVASVHAVETTPLVSAYAAAKAALVSLTRSAAIEGRPKGIRVNAVLPGAIETPMLRENPRGQVGRREAAAGRRRPAGGRRPGDRLPRVGRRGLRHRRRAPRRRRPPGRPLKPGGRGAANPAAIGVRSSFPGTPDLEAACTPTPP
jgi:NAD(P)-dependent dehydrogenase (short-subunit alcohol dehydrogenase family)